MRILQISSVPVDFLGGTEKVVRELSEELSKKNEVTILQTNLYVPHKKPGITQKKNLKIITCRNDKFLGGFGYSKEFKKILNKIYKNFDVIHVHGHGRFTSDYALRKIRNKKPIIYTAHGFFHDSRSMKIKKLYNQFFKINSKNVKFFTALTELEKKQYLKLGIPERKIKVISNWIDFSKFKKTKRKKYFENQNPVLLYVGRIHESKGLQYVLGSIKDLRINLLIVGRDSGYKKYLEEEIKKNILEKKVKFLEGVSDKKLSEIYSSSDYFVLFSAWEGFGIVILEAMCYSLPTIVSDRGALPLLVENNKTGLVAKFPNAKDLQEKIEILLNNKNLRKSISKNEIKFVKKFEKNKIIKMYEEIYYGKKIIY